MMRSRHGRLLLGLAWAVLAGLTPNRTSAQDPFDPPSAQAKAAPESQTQGASRAQGEKSASGKDKAADEPEFVVKTEEEWRKILTPAQFMVTRMKATEPAFSGKYAHGHFKGTFLCVCCGAKLFDARTKFESGTGWPSFWQAISNKAVATAMDYSELEPRVEVACRRCGAHLGHVFDDGPLPTGLRFCMNSEALKLDSEKDRPAAGRTSARTKSSRTAARTKSSRTAARKSKPTPKPEKPAAPRN